MSIGNIGRGFRNTLATIFQAGNRFIINAQGEFLYSGTPTLGNLIYSNVTNGAGVDPYGNAFMSGETLYNAASNTAINIASGTISFFDTTGGVTHGFGNLGILQSSSVFFLEASTVFAKLVTPSANAADPNIASPLTAETWHTISTGFPTGWTGTVKYRLLNDGSNLAIIDIAFTVAGGTVITNGENLSTITAGYIPANSKILNIPWAFNIGQTGQLELHASTGVLQYQGSTFTPGGTVNMFGQEVYALTI